MQVVMKQQLSAPLYPPPRKPPPPLPSTRSRRPEIHQLVRCTRPYAPTRSDELGMVVGDFIKILYIPGMANVDWCYGLLMNSHSHGWFPLANTSGANSDAKSGGCDFNLSLRRRYEFDRQNTTLDQLQQLFHSNSSSSTSQMPQLIAIQPPSVPADHHLLHNTSVGDTGKPLAEFNTATEWKSAKNILVCSFRQWLFGILADRNLKFVTHNYDWWSDSAFSHIFSVLGLFGGGGNGGGSSTGTSKSGRSSHSVIKRTVQIRRTDTCPSLRSSLALQWHEIHPDAKQTMDKEQIWRLNAIFEFIQTERDYIRDLEILMNLFLIPIRQGNLLTQAEMFKLFSNLETLLPVNKEMLVGLEKCFHSDHTIGPVGKVLKKMASFFKIYTQFCSNYSESVMFLESCTCKPFKNFLKEQYKRPEMRFLSMESFLIKPIQRICKYPLMIQEILKHTPAHHEDMQNLQESLTIFQRVVNLVNDGAKEAESMHRIYEVASSFKEKLDIIEPSRRLIKDGDVLLLAVKVGGRTYKLKTVRFFLFNDMLILGKRRSRKATFKVLIQMPLNEILVSPVSKSGVSCGHVSLLADDERDRSFQLMIATNKWIFVCGDVRERNQWVELIGKYHVSVRKSRESFMVAKSHKQKQQLQQRKSTFSIHSTVSANTSIISSDIQKRVSKRSSRFSLTPNPGDPCTNKPDQEQLPEKKPAQNRLSKTVPIGIKKSITSSPKQALASTSGPRVEIVSNYRNTTNIRDLVKRYESQSQSQFQQMI